VIEQIVGDVLSFAREHRLQRNETDLSEVVERSIEACAPQAHPEWKKIAIRRESPDDGLTIEADAGLLQQALVNVIRNALEAMEEVGAGRGDGHALTISIESRSEISGRLIEAAAIIVRDTGPGVTPEIVARMFNPFFTTRGAGTGLGLSIVHRIVDAHGGSVRVRNNRDWPGASSEAPGASVELVLPRVGVVESAAVKSNGVGSVRAADGSRA
jgi:signal transduction histidine kinase